MRINDLFFPCLIRRTQYGQYSKYHEYKQEIREDCLGRCVYCDCHENELRMQNSRQGVSLMTLDHFRPRSHYPRLVDDPYNLVWACSICNNLKGSEWPAKGSLETFVGVEGFIDPFEARYSDYFEVLTTGILRALQHPAQYMIEVLVLNRSMAVLTRRTRFIKLQIFEEANTYLEQELEIINELLQDQDLTDADRELLVVDRQNLEAQQEELRMKYFDFTLYPLYPSEEENNS